MASRRICATGRPWLFRTYAGHSTAEKSNALYRANLARGRPACRSPSICRPRPATTATTCWRAARSARSACRSPYRRHAGAVRRDPARGDEHLDDDQRDGGLAAGAVRRGGRGAGRRHRGKLQGTVQNDIIKEYLSRGTYVFPPAPVAEADRRRGGATTREDLPKWNPMNVCSYHLQEAGATPEQELAFALATAMAVLDQVKGKVPDARFPRDGRRASPSS